MGSAAENVGKRFGLLTVVEAIGRPEHVKYKSTWVRCACECGAHVVRNIAKLLNGDRHGITAACDKCVGNVRASKVLVDLTNLRFGKLVVLERISCTGPRKWRCLCDCGTEVSRGSIALQIALVRGNVSACAACAAVSRRSVRQTDEDRAARADIAKHHFIYCVTHVADQKRYVGITSRSVGRRWREHVASATTGRTSFHLHSAIRKYGEAAFTVELLEEADTYGSAQEAERWWIGHFGSDDRILGYNGTSGGESCVMSDTSKKKCADAVRLAKSRMTAEQKRAASDKGNSSRALTRAKRTQDQIELERQHKRDSSLRMWSTMTSEQRRKHSESVSAGRRRVNSSGSPI